MTVGPHAELAHRPEGDGHPYATAPDQRVPLRPVAGQSVRLGALAGPAAAGVTLEWVDDEGRAVMLPLTRIEARPVDPGAVVVATGHLTATRDTAPGGETAWVAQTPPVGAGRRYRYRFRLSEDGRGASERVATQWFEVSVASWDRDGGMLRIGGADTHELLVPDSVRWLRDASGVHAVRFALRLAEGEHVVGFGERFDALDQRGRTLDAAVVEQYKSQGEAGRTYLPMPFAHVVGGSGWGFHIRTTRRTWFDVGASEPDRLVVTAALGGALDESLDVAIYEGSPADVISAFTAEVGRAEPLPDWVFRLWASGNEWNTQRLVMERLDAHRDLDIPVGVVVIEAWSDEEGISAFRDAVYAPNTDGAAHVAADFVYPADGAWPDPAGMVRELHARGVKVVLWQIPLLRTEHVLDVPPGSQVLVDGRAMVAQGRAVRDADGSPYHNQGSWFPQALMPDLSTAEGRDWWTSKRRYLVEDLDIDGFKTDGGEHGWGGGLRYGSGRRGDQENNLVPVHHAQAFGDLLRSCGKAPVTFSRAGFTGIQAHGVVWAGDEDSTWSAFRHSITAGLTASACGIVYWGWDLAGFSGPLPSAELYLRATAAATFMPIMQYHSEFNDHRLPLRDRTPWNVAQVSGDPTVVSTFRFYAKLRDRLVPYLAESARLSIETGSPLMRALPIDLPHVCEAWAFPTQFMLGADLLVCPVVEPGRWKVACFLPDGEWVDVWTGVESRGGRTVEREAPRDVIPVWCRASEWGTLAPLFA